MDSREENMWTCQKCNKRNIPECDTALRYNVRVRISSCLFNYIFFIVLAFSINYTKELPFFNLDLAVYVFKLLL